MAAMPSLDTLLSSMNQIEQSSRQQPRVWDPQLQSNFVMAVRPSPPTGATKAGPGSPELGRAVLTVPAAQQHDLFMKNYIRPQDGVNNMRVSMQNASEVHQNATAATRATPTTHQCRVFPPLLVRYDDPKTRADAYIPVALFAGGELHYTTGFPDLILNFHADTHAITLTACQIDPKKFQQYELAMEVLYSLTVSDPDKMLTVAEFTTLYDQARYTWLRQRALAGKK